MLKDWTLTYIKNRDILHRKISTVADKGDYFLVTNADESHVVIVVKDSINDFAALIVRLRELEKLHSATKLTLVVYNTEKNLNHLMLHWKELLTLATLTVIFVNTATNEKWLISPYVHHKIADPESLELGLKSLFESIPPHSS